MRLALPAATAQAGRLVVCEGLEDGLTLLQATGIPVHVTLGTAGLAGFPLPAGCPGLVIARDNDPPGQQAALTLQERATASGIPARTISPPDGCKDFNQFLNERLHAQPERKPHV